MPVVVVHPGSPATTAGGIAVTKPLPAAPAPAAGASLWAASLDIKWHWSN